MSKPHRSLIVGLGRIGQELDYSLDNRLFQQTHASAYYSHPAFQLVGGVDNEHAKRLQFEQKYSAPSFDSVDSAMSQLNPSVVSVATPTGSHLHIFKSLLPHKPQAVLLEKPIAPSAAEARQLLTLAADNQIAVMVNYVRRYEPGTQQLKTLLDNGLIGVINKGVVYYSNGIRKNGTHFIDLLMYLLGPARYVCKTIDGRKITVSDARDSEPDLLIRFSDVPVHFIALPHECFTENSLRLSGSKGVVNYDKNGITFQNTKPLPTMKKTFILEQERHVIRTDFNRYQFHVLNAFDKILSDSALLNELDANSAQEIIALLEAADG